LVTARPPPIPPKTTRQSWRVEQTFAILLSLCLGLFLADAVVSLLDDSLILLFDLHLLSGLRSTAFFFAMLSPIVKFILPARTVSAMRRIKLRYLGERSSRG